MKHSSITLLLLLCLSFVQAQPCNPSELAFLTRQLESDCEAYFGTSSYFNVTSIIAHRNNIRTGTFLWQFRSDTVNGVWQNLPLSWQGQGTEFIDKPDFKTTDNGQYQCLFTDTVTGCTEFKRIYVKVNPRPNFNISIDSSDCGGLYLGTELNNLGNQVLTHCWEPAGPSPSSCEASGPAYLFGGVGCAMVIGTVTVMVTNQYGCENLEYISGLCNFEYLDTYASLNAPDTVFCAKSGSIEVSRSSGTSLGFGWTYQWLKNGAPLSWATTAKIKPSTTGKYKCVVTNNLGCSQITDEISVTVNKLPTFNLQPSGNTEICNKDTIVMSSGSHSSNSFAWYRNGLLTPQNTVAIDVFKAGYYKVITTTPEGCSASSTTVKINVYRSKIEATDPVVFCFGDSSILADITLNTVARQWQFNNVNIPGATSSTYAAKVSGLYRVRSTSAGGCISYSNLIDINVNCREGLEENYLLQISPVPTSHFINLGGFETSGNFRINITDMNGKIVFEKNDSQLDIHQLDVSGLVPGIYIIHFSDEAGQRNGKFIRE